MAEIKWIKITTSIFDDEAIKVIEQMPEGDAILVKASHFMEFPKVVSALTE